MARLVSSGVQALNPLIQILRPISPIAWIPGGDPVVRHR
jgi:ABC-type nitrate/sulfonate/bicarbonate transport system permease component